MILEVDGDILLTNAQVIAHGIAPHDHFNSGLALSLRMLWPELYQDFRHFCHVKNPRPGGAWEWTSFDGVCIINLFTQEPPVDRHANPGKASLKHVNHALRELRHLIEKERVKSVALPRLATGVGGLDWDQVFPLIQRHLGDLDIPVIVYTDYQKGKRAVERI